jgi:uncharacterized membrane protein YedE/YeeE
MRIHRFRFSGLIGVAFILAVVSGLMLLWRPGHAWGLLHELSSATLILGVIVHLLLHWKWIKGVVHLRTKPAKVRRSLWVNWGLLILFLLVLASVPEGGHGASSVNPTALMIHLVIGLAMAALVLVHMGLHRTCIAPSRRLYWNRATEEGVPASPGRKPLLFGE